MALERLLHCPDCAKDRVFSAVECSEGHGTHCPDLACTDCGAALLFDLASYLPRPARPTLRDVA